MKKDKRNKKIFEIYSRGRMSYRTLGRMFHLSHEMIRKIVIEEKKKIEKGGVDNLGVDEGLDKGVGKRYNG